MRVVSVNVGRPRAVEWHGESVRTSIFKSAVSGPVAVGARNLAGDEQSDLSVHGGVDKAVYAYPSEHYASWARELPGAALAWGAFGENLTLEGLLEDTTCIGDRIAIGTAEFTVTQPRLPCFKLEIRFGREDIIRRFLQSGRSGFYLSVAREGRVAADDTVQRVSRGAEGVTVADIVRLHAADRLDADLLRRASEVEALPAGWRDRFRKRLSMLK